MDYNQQLTTIYDVHQWQMVLFLRSRA
jgi:hypothetical protein